jgi:hypothetical protein
LGESFVELDRFVGRRRSSADLDLAKSVCKHCLINSPLQYI